MHQSRFQRRLHVICCRCRRRM